MTSLAPMMPQVVVLRRAFWLLPQQVLAEAELDDQAVLRAYRRSSPAQLGLGDHALPLDSRRRLTEKGGGGGGLASAELESVVGAQLGTVVDTYPGMAGGMYGVTRTQLMDYWWPIFYLRLFLLFLLPLFLRPSLSVLRRSRCEQLGCV